MFSSHINGELVLIIDVQSSIVRSTLVFSLPQSIPLVVHTGKFRIPFKAEADNAYLVKMAMQGIDGLLNEVSKHIHDHNDSDPAFPRKISSVHYVLSSPWVLSEAKALSLSFEKETSVSKAYITGMIWEQRQKLTAEHTGNLCVIEEKVFDVRLNGYSVASWESRQTKELEVSFLVSLAGKRTIERFIAACERIVKKDRVQFHSSLFLQHSAIGVAIPDHADYALIHIHGELTDVAFVRAHSSTYFGSFPFGIHTIIRSVAESNHVDMQSADSILSMAVEETLDPTHARTESTSIKNLGAGWVEEFQRLASSSPAIGAVPNRIIVSAHAHEKFFLKCLSEAYPHATIDILNMEDILPYVAFDPQTDRLRLSALYTIAIHRL